MGTIWEGLDACFSSLPNTSCSRALLPRTMQPVLYSVLFFILLLTVSLNLLIIVSIAYFRQLHTPTNLLLLSLAVSDLFVGLLLMPAQILLIGGCWFLGSFACGFFYYTSFILTSASVGTMVLISIDRYVSICEPLSYPSKVTQGRVKVCVCVCWALSVLYNGVILRDFLKNPDLHNSCYGQCIVVIDSTTGAVDVVLTFVCPVTIIVVLYVRVFVAALSQARAMRCHAAAVSMQGSVTVRVKKSEIKAARTLGIIVSVFVVCFCPYFYPSLAGQDLSTSGTFSVFGVWLFFCNSLVNPLIYAFFYPWFRRALKLIVTFQLSHSRNTVF